MHAPDMSPTLDDALQAWDRLARNQASNPLTDMARVRMFLDQLDEVRNVPAVVLDPEQSRHMEGAYQAGVRCADESGHVLVVSLPAFLELFPVPRRDGLLAPFGRFAAWLVKRPQLGLALALLLGALVALLADHDAQAAGWLAFAGGVLVVSWCVSQLPPTRCTYECRSGRACTCRPQPNGETQHG